MSDDGPDDAMRSTPNDGASPRDPARSQDRIDHPLSRVEGTPPSRGDGIPPFLLGFNAQVIQLVLFREVLMLSSGSELALGLALAAWALFNGAGALAGCLLLRLRVPLGRAFAVGLIALPPLLAVSVQVSRGAWTLTGLTGAEAAGPALFSLLAALVLAPATFLDGALFTMALDGWKRVGRARGAPFTYGFESLGSLAGGLLFAFLLVDLLDPFSIAGLLLILDSVLLGGVSSVLSLPGGRTRRAVRAVGLVLGLVAVLLGPGWNRASEARRWARLQPALTWVESRETRHQNLALLEYEGETSIYGNGRLLFTLRSCPSSESGDWDRAAFPHFALLQVGTPKRIVLVGGGARGLLPDLLDHDPEHVDWVEYDGMLADLVRDRMIDEDRCAFDDQRVRFHEGDGRRYIRKRPPGFADAILLDLPDPSNAAVNRYYTKDFFRDCEAALAPGGVLALSLSSQVNYLGEETRRRNGSIYRALREVFEEVRATPGEVSYFVAGREGLGLSMDPDALRTRYEARGIETDRFSPYLFYTLLETDDVAWINGILAEDFGAGRHPANRDDRPLAYYADTRLLTRIAGEAEEVGFLDRADRWLLGGGDETGPLPWICCLGLVFPLAGGGFLLLGKRKRGPRDSGEQGSGGRGSREPDPGRRKGVLGIHLAAAGAAGFSGITFEVALLLAFQNLSGLLYSAMGGLIAAYMAGLAAGALVAGRRSPRGAYAGAAGLALTVALAFPVTPHLLAGVAIGQVLTLFMLLAATAGAAGGCVFGAAARSVEDSGPVTGGWIYVADVIGTCFGGWQAGALLVPLLGLDLTVLCGGGALILCALFAALHHSTATFSSCR